MLIVNPGSLVGNITYTYFSSPATLVGSISNNPVKI